MKLLRALSLLAVAVALLVGSSLGSQAAPADRPLWQASAQKSVPGDVTFQALTQLPDTAAIQLVKVDADALTGETVQLTLPGGRDVVARRTEARPTGEGRSAWHGELSTSVQQSGKAEARIDEMNAVALVRNGDRVTGSIRVEGQLYRLVPVRSGLHAVVQVDERRSPVSADPRATPEPAPAPKAQAPQASTVRVLVAVSATAAERIDDVNALADLAIEESNRGLANSLVPVTFELAGIHQTQYAETAGADHLGRLQKTSDGIMDEVHAARNATAADVVVLLAVEPSYCGLGYVNVAATFAFSVVNWTCATGNYSFAHEIGHNFGALHDPLNSTNTAYPYGHGYQHQPGTAGDWRTVMAYDCTGGCPRINYWSNPRVTYNGARMGTAGKHDNARVLTTRAAAVAAFRA
ncbi:M12 family metallo-peptidase [Kribbella sp. DT2]|uniref:M12 family metallo-peptidase n=1 Tax=Kribbella sp. DT2 TaxID=3393427 RepID=UPI003CF24542